MNLLITTGIFPPDVGGPATYVPRIANSLRDRGWNVEVLTAGTESAGRSFPYPVHRVPRPIHRRVPGVIKQLKQRAGWANCLYVNGLSMEVQLARTLIDLPPSVRKIVGDRAWERYRNQCPNGVTIEQYPSVHPPPGNWFYRCLHRFGARREECLTVPSRFLKQIVKRWGVPADAVTVIRNTVHPPEPIAPEPAGWPDRGSIKLLTAGRLVPWKRTADLIQRVAETEEYRLVVLGDGPGWNECRERVAELGVTDRISLAGTVPRGVVWRYLREADLFLLHSTYEGFPHVLLESMANGLPVLAADAGGTAELAEFFPDRIHTYPRKQPDRLTERLRQGTFPDRFEPGSFPAPLRWDTILDRTADLLEQRARA